MRTNWLDISSDEEASKLKVGEVAGFPVYKISKSNGPLYIFDNGGEFKYQFDYHTNPGQLRSYKNHKKGRCLPKYKGRHKERTNWLPSKDRLFPIFLNYLEEIGEQKAAFVDKIFNINKHKFTREELKHKGDLDLSDTYITKLPHRLEVSGNLNLRMCEYLQNLPDGLKVGGDLDLQFTDNIRKLPSNIKVGGTLNLKYYGRPRNIKWLPSGLKVGGDLILESSTIHHLPPDLEVGGNVYVEGTPYARNICRPRRLRAVAFMIKNYFRLGFPPGVKGKIIDK